MILVLCQQRDRKETVQMTGLVFAFVVVLAIFLWMVDAGLLLLVKSVMGRGEGDG